MMEKTIDHFLFAVSADCFSEVFDMYFGGRSIDLVRKSARECILELLNGGGDYYLSAGFSKMRFAKTEEDFFSSAATFCNVWELSILRTLSYIARGASGEAIWQVNIVNSILERIGSLEIDTFKLVPSDFQLEIFFKVSEVDVPNYYYWSDAWKGSSTKWDSFLKAMLGDNAFLPFDVFDDIVSKMNMVQIIYWRKNINKDEFSVLMNFLIAESKSEIGDFDLQGLDILMVLNSLCNS